MNVENIQRIITCELGENIQRNGKDRKKLYGDFVHGFRTCEKKFASPNMK